jgi:hypothetical protein
MAAGASKPPAPTAKAPAANQSRTFSSETPPVGSRTASGKGPRKALRYDGPLIEPGQSLTTSASRLRASISSVGVRMPGMTARPVSSMSGTRTGAQPGLTRKTAPSATACSTCPGSTMVPAPSRMRPPYSWLRSTMTFSASGVVKVIRSPIPRPRSGWRSPPAPPSATRRVPRRQSKLPDPFKCLAMIHGASLPNVRLPDGLAAKRALRRPWEAPLHHLARSPHTPRKRSPSPSTHPSPSFSTARPKIPRRTRPRPPQCRPP